jgi:hypothetical protein
MAATREAGAGWAGAGAPKIEVSGNAAEAGD